MSLKINATAIAVLAALVLSAGPVAAKNKDTVTAFRMTKLELRDPHVVLPVAFFTYDITSDVNTFINKQFAEDSSRDGYVDASFLTVFDPLDQWTDEGIVEIAQGKCTAASRGSECRLDAKGKAATVYYTNKRSGTCADVISRTVSWRSSVTPVTGPCFFTEPSTFGVDLAGIKITLEHAVVSARWIGEPATRITGLVRGFISLKDARTTKMPHWVPTVGKRALSEIVDYSDMDYGPDGTTRGYWLYLNFEATVVNVIE